MVSKVSPPYTNICSQKTTSKTMRVCVCVRARTCWRAYWGLRVLYLCLPMCLKVIRQAFGANPGESCSVHCLRVQYTVYTLCTLCIHCVYIYILYIEIHTHHIPYIQCIYTSYNVYLVGECSSSYLHSSLSLHVVIQVQHLGTRRKYFGPQTLGCLQRQVLHGTDSSQYGCHWLI